MKRIVSMLAIVAVLAFSLNSCAPKDADIKKAVDTAIAANPDATNVLADVQKGVLSLSGEVKDESVKSTIEATLKAVKGVKSVVNNLSVTPPAPVISVQDEALIKSLTDALKDNQGVIFDVKEGVVTLTGEVKKADLKKLMQKVQALNPVKVDSKALTIK